MRDIPKEQRTKAHTLVIEGNWAKIAGIAWAEYRERGRGAVVIQEDDFLDVPNGLMTVFRINYISPLRKKVFQAIFSEKDMHTLQTYDPETQVMVMVMRGDCRLATYIAQGEPDPPIAYDLRMSERN
jgi:hypothetical protein